MIYPIDIQDLVGKRVKAIKTSLKKDELGVLLDDGSLLRFFDEYYGLEVEHCEITGVLDDIIGYEILKAETFILQHDSTIIYRFYTINEDCCMFSVRDGCLNLIPKEVVDEYMGHIEQFISSGHIDYDWFSNPGFRPRILRCVAMFAESASEAMLNKYNISIQLKYQEYEKAKKEEKRREAEELISMAWERHIVSAYINDDINPIMVINYVGALNCGGSLVERVANKYYKAHPLNQENFPIKVRVSDPLDRQSGVYEVDLKFETSFDIVEVVELGPYKKSGSGLVSYTVQDDYKPPMSRTLTTGIMELDSLIKLAAKTLYSRFDHPGKITISIHVQDSMELVGIFKIEVGLNTRFDVERIDSPECGA